MLDHDRMYLERLRKLIGRECVYFGKPCLVVDLLQEEGLLILEVRDRLPPIQTDQYGRASGRYNEILQVPVFTSDGSSFTEEMIDLFDAIADVGGEL